MTTQSYIAGPPERRGKDGAGEKERGEREARADEIAQSVKCLDP